MSLETARAFLARHAPDIEIIELSVSTATVAEAAAGHGVEPGQIAKTLSLRVGEDVILVVAAGDARLDNRKIKERFGAKPRMLDAQEVEARIGHPVGGVCPFGVPDDVALYCDVSLKAYPMVVPAAGSRNSAVHIAPERLAKICGAEWIDICKTTEPAQAPATNPHQRAYIA